MWSLVRQDILTLIDCEIERGTICTAGLQQGTTIWLQASLQTAELSSAASAAQTSSSAPLRLLRLLRAHAPGLLR